MKYCIAILFMFLFSCSKNEYKIAYIEQCNKACQLTYGVDVKNITNAGKGALCGCKNEKRLLTYYKDSEIILLR